MKKIIKFNKLNELVNDLKKSGQRVVLTNGCFDILHVGHLQTLRLAKKEGDILIVGVNSDSSVKKIKGVSRPIICDHERAELIAALEVVDYVTIFTEETAASLLENVRPDIYVKGGDYTLKDLPEWPVIQDYKIRVKFINLVEGRSTTDIIKEIKEMEKC